MGSGWTVVAIALAVTPLWYIISLVPRSWLASFPGLQSPNAVEGLVKLIRRMTSGRRWVYIYGGMGGHRVDVWRRGTSGEVQSAA